MQPLSMPIVEVLLEQFCAKDFSKIRIIGVQHVLETTHAMFQYLYRYGLKPKNVSLLGKCYSTCQEVFDEMQADGIDVSFSSFAYNAHRSFDDMFNQEVDRFLEERVSDITGGGYDLIIVLDDGGKCINALLGQLDQLPVPVVAIEQTSAGYHAVKGKHLPFPVINVARSPIKLTYESPMIAHAGAERLYDSLKAKKIPAQSALIIGGGAIGQAMKARLENEMAVVVFDSNAMCSDTANTLEQLIPKFNLIIGCTGRTSISLKQHHLLSEDAVLVSVSSSDREFDSVSLRKKIDEQYPCHEDLIIGKQLLVNSGFPVNFDGDRENIDTDKIQLTIALIAAGILQATDLFASAQSGLLPVDGKLEQFIENKFIESQASNIIKI